MVRPSLTARRVARSYRDGDTRAVMRGEWPVASGSNRGRPRRGPQRDSSNPRLALAAKRSMSSGERTRPLFVFMDALSSPADSPLDTFVAVASRGSRSFRRPRLRSPRSRAGRPSDPDRGRGPGPRHPVGVTVRILSDKKKASSLT